MIQVDVKFDVQRALANNRDRQRAVRQAAARALNRTAQQVQSAAIKAIAKETGLKQKDVRPALRRVNAKASDLLALVIATGTALNLIRFTRQTRAQARRAGGVIANAWGRRKLYRGTFIGNLGRTVFVRETAARLPIHAVSGPSIPGEFARAAVAKQMQSVAHERWPINLDSDLRYYLERAR